MKHYLILLASPRYRVYEFSVSLSNTEIWKFPYRKAAKSVEILGKFGITHVLNTSYVEGLSTSMLGVHTNSAYYSLRNYDVKFHGIAALDHAGFNMIPYIEAGVDFIDKALESNGKHFLSTFFR